MGDPINDFASGFSKNQLIGYFLILWAITFLFSAVYGFINLGDQSLFNMIIDGLWSLADVGIAGILVLLGVKTLNEN